MNDRTYEIPESNMERLHHEIAKLNKRGEKIGCPPVTVEKIRTFERIAPGYEEQAEILGPNYVPHAVVHEVRLHGEGPKLAGWKFVGALDHVTLPGVVIVNTVPGETVPVEYHGHDAVCDHCGKIRRRNDTFVLQHDDGHHTQVGRQCLRDFLGHDPAAIARFLTRTMRFMNDLGGEDWYGGGGQVAYSFDHFRVLQMTAAVINASGWVPRSAADAGVGGRAATADVVLDAFCPPKDASAYRKWKKWREGLDLDRKEFVEDAMLAREWLKKQPGNNEYMHNLHMIDQADSVPMKLFGYWCSLLATYQRAQERLRLQEAQRKNYLNEWVGNLKERIETEVQVVSIRSSEGYYGTVHIHRMLDMEGRTLVWFCNAERTMREGQKYRIKGTITKHTEFQDWKQTNLNRVRVLESLE